MVSVVTGGPTGATDNDASVAGPDCLICQKHAGVGPLVSPHLWEDDLVRVSHIPPVDEPKAFVGHLVIETQRHVGYLDELSDDEAAAVGRAARTAARAIRAELGAESVFSAVIGIGVPHFHQHVWPKHPGTPDRYDWHRVDEWPDAPRAIGDELDTICDRLRPYFT